MQDLQTEYSRALSNSRNGAELTESFGMEMRTGELNSFQDGDIITFPELKYSVGEDGKAKLTTVDGKKVVITEDMMRNGAKTGRKLTYMFVEVNRNGSTAIARLFPSMFWKRRRRVEEVGGVWEEVSRDRDDAWAQSHGEVVDFAKSFASVDQAIYNIAKQGKKILVTLEPVDCFAFQSDEKVTENVYNLTWV